MQAAVFIWWRANSAEHLSSGFPLERSAFRARVQLSCNALGADGGRNEAQFTVLTSEPPFRLRLCNPWVTLNSVFTILTTAEYDEWFANLKDRTARMRITSRLTRVEMGNFGDVEPVGGGISELRLDFGPGYRLYFTRRGIEVVLLLVGGDKSTQARDIRRARQIAAHLRE